MSTNLFHVDGLFATIFCDLYNSAVTAGTPIKKWEWRGAKRVKNGYEHMVAPERVYYHCQAYYILPVDSVHTVHSILSAAAGHQHVVFDGTVKVDLGDTDFGGFPTYDTRLRLNASNSPSGVGDKAKTISSRVFHTWRILDGFKPTAVVHVVTDADRAGDNIYLSVFVTIFDEDQEPCFVTPAELNKFDDAPTTWPIVQNGVITVNLAAVIRSLSEALINYVTPSPAVVAPQKKIKKRSRPRKKRNSSAAI